MVQEINDINQFLHFLKQHDIAINPYLSYSYLKHYLVYYQPKKFIGLVILNEQEEVLALVPFEKEGRTIRLCGYKASNYNGMILVPSTSYEQVFPLIKHYLATHYPHNNLFLYDINDQDPLYSYLIQYGKPIPQFVCPQANIQQEFSALFEQSVQPGKKRTELRKFARRLAQMGKVEYVEIRDAQTLDQYRDLLPRLKMIHQERFSSLKTNSSVIFYRHWEYYLNLLHDMLEAKRAILSLVLLDGVPISFIYTLVADTTVVDWMVAFDLAFSKLSLGTIHLMHFLEYLCETSEFLIFDFSKGDSPYKRRWSSTTSTNHCFVISYHKTIVNRVCALGQTSLTRLISFLREKGIIHWIRRLLGKSTTKQEVDSMSQLDGKSYLAEHLSYDKIATLSLNERRPIIEELYSLL